MSQEKKKKKFGLLPQLIVAIILGALVGQMTFIPEIILQIPVTFSDLFGNILSFFIPLMIVGFIVKGIADLSEGAGRLLGATAGIAYLSTLIAGTVAYLVANFVFPLFIEVGTFVGEAEGEGLAPIFTVEIPAMFEVTSAIVFAFMFGITISWLRTNKESYAMYNFFDEFNQSVIFVLERFIVPLLPFFIFGNFINLSYAGTFGTILSVFWRVFLVILILHWVFIILWFVLAGSYAGKNPWTLIKNQLSGYIAAVGLQSSAATIPINLEIARKNGVSQKIRDFVVPFCATAHLMGSMITITSCVMAVLMMNDMPSNYGIIGPFIITLGIAMVAAPGAPGGAIMAALPFLGMVGIDPSGALASLLVSLYIAQDSFGTATNISGDNAIAVLIDKWFNKNIGGGDINQASD
ncbi:Glutamate-aspartate carrier protein [Alloiococcus otitis]|uniref:Uncharacterized protein n=1 Tax=Alloiococcus otitis ATCC 51267 TaxID=883081 RepID=K9EQP1_9LACT|nr:dicarboxylate/amino acid:cation symporter [Alloiococcus otitis]EKU93247.1 hypothetical protein HMPREF9698_01408 [Alloiococcus otitis ATCC 51267]SUU80585.1 Glutamate-aspartate carrier protein [Alloiococcus otitis]